MIIRIMGDQQYEVKSSILDQLNKIDNKIVELVAKGDEKNFRKELLRMINLVRKKGKPLDPRIIVESQLIIPPEDLTLEEARKIFTGEGIIPG
ncbi:MAG: hypothetical protein QXJ68_07685 [Methanocellales archaeon]